MRPSHFQGNIHIINFPASTAPGDLAALFDDFGLVMGAQIKAIQSDGGQLRLGIVSVAPDAAADKAIEALQGYSLGGQKLKLKRAKPQPPKAKKPGMQQRPRQAPMSQSAMSQAALSSAEQFPSARYDAPPRKVIVEYKGRRSRAGVRAL